MKKTIQRLYSIFLHITLATLLFATSLVVVFKGAGTETASGTVVASAATMEKQKPLGDDNFAFYKGAAVNGADYYGYGVCIDKLGFTLQLKNPQLKYRKNEKDKREYHFTFHRQNMDGSSTPVSRLTILCRDEVKIVYKEEYLYTSDTFSFDPGLSLGWGKSLKESNAKEWKKEVEAYKKKGLDLVAVYQVANGTDSDFSWRTDEKRFEFPYLYAYASLESATTSYFVEFDYKYETEKSYKEWTYFPFIWYETKTKYETTESGKIYSDVRSVKQVLTAMDEAGDLEVQMQKIANEYVSAEALTEKAREIIGYQEDENVCVSYLEQIGSTPFAKRIKKTITVAKEGDVLRVDAVASKLNLDTFSALNAECYNFTYNPATNTYDAVYLKNVYLTIRTVDGNTPDASGTAAEKYYLDVNQSFADYYGGLCDVGVISESQYEWLFSQILKQYPALSGFKMDEVYGCFGYAAIPEFKYSSINGFFANVFDLQNSNAGVFIMQQWKELLTAAQYDRMLTEYQYSWLERAWHDVINGITGWNYNAVHFAFVAKDLTGNVVISDNGSTTVKDNDGLIENTVQKVVVEIKDTISGDNDEGRALKVILGVAIGGLAVFGIAYGVIKLKNLSESKK